MATLIIRSPGVPDQTFTLTDKPLVIGRGDGADAFIPERKSSRRHVRIVAVEGGGFVAEELGSSNGTWLASPDAMGVDQRVLRRLLVDGDELRIGDTSLTFHSTAPAAPAHVPSPADAELAALLVGGTLAIRAVTDVAADAIPSAERAERDESDDDASVGSASTSSRNGDPVRRGATRSSGSNKALVMVLIAAAIVVGEQFLLGGQAKNAGAEAEALTAYVTVLDHLEAPTAEFSAEVAAFEDTYPDSPYNEMLRDHLTYARDRDDHRRLVTEELDLVRGRSDKVDASLTRSSLMGLMRKLPSESKFDVEFRKRARHHIGVIDKRRAVFDQERIEALRHEVRLALGADRPARALRVIASFRVASPGMLSDTAERLDMLEGRAQSALQSAFDQAWAAADKAKTATALRSALKGTWQALAGTELGARLENRIRDSLRKTMESVDQPGRPDTPGSAGKPTDTPPAPSGLGDAVLAKAERAQSLIIGRSWTAGLKLLAEVLTRVDRGRLKNEWSRLQADTARVTALATGLGERANGERAIKRTLSLGKVVVTAATVDGVTWTMGGGEPKTTLWANVPDEDVLILLVPRKPKPAERLAGAMLAADLSDRDAMNALLVPLFEKEALIAEASQLVAWRLHGRSAPPAGGYKVYAGQIVDQQGYDRLREQERIASHRARAGVLEVQLAKQRVFRKVAKMAKLRTELDSRRKYALLAIFNVKHYPYPANKSGKPYRAVQKEIDIRIDAVREIWDDTYTFKIDRKGKVGQMLSEYDQIVTVLQRLGQDVREMKKAIQPYAMYATGETITVRKFYLTAKERERYAYNRWVIASYNPARTEYAKETERRQTRVTNDYRIMMAFQAQVRPGNASFESIDEDSVVPVLDAGKVLRLIPLRAVRVDNRLVDAARGHSLDMQKRGYFSHFSKPNPATGQGQTSPFDRMRKAGYGGFGSSENIANGAGSPERAHWMWRHSSGHHRNLISNWIDMGCGHAGRLWTQNFGMGGGGPARVQDTTEIKAGAGGSRGPRTPRSGG